LELPIKEMIVNGDEFIMSSNLCFRHFHFIPLENKKKEWYL